MSIVTGNFEQSMSPGGTLLSSVGGVGIFLVSYDTDGVFRWSKRFGAPGGGDTGRALVVDSIGNVHVTGWANGSVDFGNGSVTTDNQDVPILSFNSDGDLQRSTVFGGPGVDQGQSIAVDSQGRVFVTGNFETSIDLGDGEAESGGDMLSSWQQL